MKMFDKLTFFSEKEKADFEKYKVLKGTYLHLQIYNLLLEKGKNSVTYYDLSSHIRYDKNLRDKLYIYLATFEEWLRAMLIDRYDVSDENKKYGQHCFKPLKQDLIQKSSEDASNLYFSMNADLSVLMQLCDELSITQIGKARTAIKELRNETMHHSLLMFGNTRQVAGLHSYFCGLENKVNALLRVLPPEYQKGFISDICRLNGKPESPYLSFWFLEVKDGRICIKE